jgi:hypothetical protein
MLVKSWSCRAGALALASVLGSSPLPAQQYWPDRGDGTVVRADFLKPFFKEEGFQFLSGVVFFSGSGSIGKSLRIEADVPLARAGVSIAGLPSQSSLRLGNPYIGLRIHRAGLPLAGYFGARLPLASDPTSFVGGLTMDVGSLSDFDRFEAFLPKVFTVRTGVELRSVSPEGALLGAKLGPTLLVATEGGAGDDAELFADYGVQAGYEGAAFRATMGFTGRLLATEEGGSFADRTEHFITGMVELRRGQVRPSVLIRMPLDKEVREITSVTIGFGLAIVL